MTRPNNAKIHGLLLLLLMAACGPGGSTTGNALVDAGGEWHGRVIAPAGDGTDVRGVAGAEVRIGKAVARTDDDGFWRLEADALGSSTVAVYKEGFAPASQAFDARSRFVQTALTPAQLVQEIKVDEESVLVYDEDQDGVPDASVVIPAAAIDTTFTTVTASLSLVRPQIKGEFARFPGTFLAASENDATPRDLLRTFGTLDVSFSKDGVLLPTGTLKKPASIQFALATGVNPDAVTSTTVIPTWWLDVTTGVWHREGEATLVQQNGTWLAQWDVSHFTWWNLDRALEEHGCLAVYVEASSELAEASGVTLSLLGDDYAGRSETKPLVFNEYIVLTGWKGHAVHLDAWRNGVGFAPMTGVLAPRNADDGDTARGVYVLPETVGSGTLGKGPGGVALDPAKHCKVVRRTSDELGLKQGVLQGRVFDVFRNPLAGATVYITETGQVAKTNADGHYAFEHVPWSETLPHTLTVRVLDFAAGDVTWLFEDQTVARDAAESTATFVSTGIRDFPPVVVATSFDTTSPYSGQTVGFSVRLKDKSAALTAKATATGGAARVSTAQTAEGFLVSGTWAAPEATGAYVLTIDVTDSSGNATRVVQKFLVSNPAPVVKVSGPGYVSLGDTATYTVSASDPNGDDLTVSIAVDGATIYSGRQGAAVPVTFAGDGPHAVKATASDGRNVTQVVAFVTVGSVVVGSPSGDFGLRKTAETLAGNALDWDLVVGTAAYIIERAPLSSPAAFQPIATTALTTFMDASMSQSIAYAYRVRACMGGLCSVSNAVTFSPVVFAMNPATTGTASVPYLAENPIGYIDDQHVFFTWGETGAAKFYLSTVDTFAPVLVDADGADNVRLCKVSPLASHVVCVVDFAAAGTEYLYAFDVSTQSSVRLSHTIAASGGVRDNFLITPDDQRVVYQAGNYSNAPLYSVAITGGTPTKLTDFTAGTEEVCYSYPNPNKVCPQLSADGSRVVYTWMTSFSAPTQQIFASPLTGYAPLQIGKAVTAGVVRDFKVSPIDAGVLYRADHDVTGSPGLYYADAFTGFVRAIEPSGNPAGHTVDWIYDFAKIDAAGTLGAVYATFLSSYHEGWSVSPLDVGNPVTIVTGDMVQLAASYRDFRLTPDLKTLVYRYPVTTAPRGIGLFTLEISTATVTRISDVQGVTLGAGNLPLVTERSDMTYGLVETGQTLEHYLYFYAPGMSSPLAVEAGNQGPTTGAWSDHAALRYLADDTLRVAFVAYRMDLAPPDRIFTADVKTGAVTAVRDLSASFPFPLQLCGGLAWIADTNRVVFIADPDGSNRFQIYSARAR